MNKLFTAQPNTGYSGGCIIISAKNITEAEKIVTEEVLKNEWYNYHNGFCDFKELPNCYYDGKSGIISDFTYIE